MTKQQLKAERTMLYNMQQRASKHVPDWHDYERGIFGECKGVRTQKRVKNTWSKEQAGTCGTYIAIKRFSNSRLTCVCKSRNLY